MADHLVLVGLAADAHAREADLGALADAVGARVAYLQLGEPALHDVLDELARDGRGRAVDLVATPSAGTPAPARSWLRRVAGDWVRRNPDALRVRVVDRPVTGEEAGLTSPAWDAVPGHGRHVLVCRGPRCTARGAAGTAAALAARLRERGLGDDAVLVAQSGCLYPCNHAPVVVVHPDDAWWGPVTAEDAAALVDSWADTPAGLGARAVRRPPGDAAG
ncbi:MULTISPECIES: ferredoxin [Actinosynnema]|uniref:(2Fe-2S) ferredoxin domain-containing protein n=1 Tax=Actinosynnema TaxID=40566 RepID=UPI0020A3058E|nr:(2Fe-2S) ferredoxin domain-containing protein [Actinosynnema pretiosum]MCP2098749.1 hypothetical protein [Actinosynnema pretiosum]